MVILFSLGVAEQYIDASAKIVIKMAEELNKKGHKCYITGICTTNSINEITDGGVHIIRQPAIKPIIISTEKHQKISEMTADVDAARNYLIKKHPLHAMGIFFKYTQFYKNRIELPRYERQVKKLIKDIKPDAIVCICKPVDAFRAIMESNISLPKYVWQLDPWGLDKLDNIDTEIETEKELSVFKKARHIFTTVALKEQYSKHAKYSQFTDKMTAVEFPNIEQFKHIDAVSPVEFDSEHINMVFCGTLSDDYRSPEKLLKCLTPLFENNEKVRAYFIGRGKSNSIKEYSEKYPDNVFRLWQVPSQQAFAAMEKADILINISNVVDNMVPSKIFDYFSMGKPVINLQKIENCPSREYFDRYPLAFTVEDFSETDISKLFEFIKMSKGKIVPFDYVEKTYKTATVDYVTTQIETELLKKVKNMKLLFSTGFFEKSLNANTKIVLQIANELAKRGHNCVTCGVCTDYPGKEITNDNVIIERLPAIPPVVKSSQLLINLTEKTGDVSSARNLMIKRYPLSAAMLFVKYHKIYKEKIEQPRYEKQLKKIINDFNPDAIVCICNPVLAVKTIMESNITIPKYIWQMDPWGLHKLDFAGKEEQAISEELEAFDKARHIFTTTILYNQYLSRNDYSVYRNKLSPIEFPNIIPFIPGREKCPIDFDSDYINLLYCGTISDDIRNPEKLLKDISQLFDKKIRLYFMGTGSSNSLNVYANKYPDNIIKTSRFSSQQAFRAMEKADILINISNAVDNMVPSKIFDYFSIGKPIINLQKIENCSSRDYFDRYPLAFTVEDFSKTDIDQLHTFISNSRYKHVPFEDVKNIYSTATVDYVSNQIETTLATLSV